MDEETKKYLSIGAAVICLLITGTIFYRTMLGGSSGSGGANREAALLCTTCGGFEIPADVLREMMSQQDPATMMMRRMPAAMECPQCGKKTCYEAQKCQQCENIFVVGQARDRNYPDRCPKCSFSYIEDRRQNPSP
jgi:hypothetical protein